MQNRCKHQQIFAIHDSVILPKYLLLDSLILQFRMVINDALQLFLNVADGYVPRKLRMYQVFLRILLEILVYSHHSVFIIPEKQMAQLLQLLKSTLRNAKGSPIDGMRLVMLYCSFLGLDRLFLVELKEFIEAEVRRNLSGIGQQVKDEKRCTERQDLNDNNRLQSVQFFLNLFLEFLLLRCQGLILDPFEHHQIKVILEILLEPEETFLCNMRCLLAIHDSPLKS